jgi:hypothetical protein
MSSDVQQLNQVIVTKPQYCSSLDTYTKQLSR